MQNSKICFHRDENNNLTTVRLYDGRIKCRLCNQIWNDELPEPAEVENFENIFNSAVNSFICISGDDIDIKDKIKYINMLKSSPMKKFCKDYKKLLDNVGYEKITDQTDQDQPDILSYLDHLEYSAAYSEVRPHYAMFKDDDSDDNLYKACINNMPAILNKYDEVVIGLTDSTLPGSEKVKYIKIYLDPLHGKYRELAKNTLARVENSKKPIRSNKNKPEPNSIDILELSVRTNNLLKREAKCTTIDKLKELSVEDLHSLRKCGEATINEIITKCKEHGISLKTKDNN
jgi:hypothetical protein